LFIAIIAIIASTIVAMSNAQPQNDLLSRVDHLVYATPDLEAGVDNLEKLLGVRATTGGQHPGRGTRNALIALGTATYIEIIARDPKQRAPAPPRPFGLDNLSESRLVTWAAKETDLPALVRRAGDHGVKLGEVAAGSRQRPDGLLLTWQYTNPQVVVADGVVPFFINWGATPHPAASAVQGGKLVALTAEHPDADKVIAMLAGLGLELPVKKAARPALIAAIDTAHGRVELR